MFTAQTKIHIVSLRNPLSFNQALRTGQEHNIHDLFLRGNEYMLSLAAAAVTL